MARSPLRRVAARLGAAGPASDRHLLDRYVRDKDDGAFAELVGRHGRAVLAACRQVLADPADVDDAFQATFLVLVRRAGEVPAGPSVGGWLFGVAHRVAVAAARARARKVRREAAAAARTPVTSAGPDPSWREAVATLHQELDRLPDKFRLPLVLCYLDGLSRDEAAAHLGWPPGAVKAGLERGRARLRARLERRGVTLSAGLLAAVAGDAPAVPPGLVAAAVRAAAGGGPPSVLQLARATMTGFGTRAKFVLGPLAAAGVCAGLLTAWAAGPPPEPPKGAPAGTAAGTPAPPAGKAVAGRVVGPDGNPVAGAVIAVPDTGEFGDGAPVELAKTAADGTFRCVVPPAPAGPDYRTLVARAPGLGPDWANVAELAADPVTFRLVPDDVPVRGRVTDLEGKPVAGATVVVRAVHAAPGGDLGPVIAKWREGPEMALRMLRGKELHAVACGGLPARVTADKDGRFEVRGAGRGRLVSLRFEGPGIETAAARAATVPGFDPKAAAPTQAELAVMKEYNPHLIPGPALYGPDLTHAARPAQAVAGTVTDAKTGKPLAGVQVSGSVKDGWWENNATTKTDAAGRYRLTGVAKGERKLYVFPGEDSPYLTAGLTVPDAPGLADATADVKLARGVLVTGRVTDKATGRPVRGAAVDYLPLRGNTFVATTPGTDIYRMANGPVSTGADGRYRKVVLPGVGLLTAQGETRGPGPHPQYTQVRLRPEDEPRAYKQQRKTLGEAFVAHDGHYAILSGQSAYQVIDPPEGAGPVTLDLQFDPGESVTGTVVGPDGKPAAGAAGYGLSATYPRPTNLRDGAFTAVALDPAHPRVVAFVDAGRKLAGRVTLAGTEKGPVVVALRPWAAVAGRVVGGDGSPVAGVEVRADPAAPDEMSRGGVRMGFQDADQVTTTAADGRFRLDVPFADLPVRLGFSRQGKYLKPKGGNKDVTAPAGGVNDLGDIRVETSE